MAEDTRKWLEAIGLGEYADAFEENRLGLNYLSDLTEDDLKELGVLAMGDRKALMRAIAGLDSDEVPSNSNEIADTLEQRSAIAERRQLTVMFCDLVGSTALSRQLDPEDLRDVMRRYQDAVAGAVTRYGGHVAKYLGDGVLAYFGWPQAYEDQAERAVHAGLDAIRIVNDVQIADGSTLQARVGISTGQVVVGDLVGESGRDAAAVTGETPNLAARLQAVAKPGQVVIGDTTRRLIGQAFLLNDMGEQDLKGFEQHRRAWSVSGEQALETRFEATHQGKLTRLVGREGELRLLLDRWEIAKNGEGQVVLLCGEPGIGKSRLSQALRDTLGSEEHIRIRYQCSPYHINGALYPTIQQLQHAAGFEVDDNDDVKLDKLEGLLRQGTQDIDKISPLFANLLSLSFEHRYGPLEQGPAQIKQETLRAIVDQLRHLAGRQPVLFLLEDAHWIDPTSLELLQLTVGTITDAPVLMVVTHRPEWQSPFGDLDHITPLQLNRLGKAQGAEIVQANSGDYIPEDVVERIVSRTDGIPLFVEELTKSLVEGGLDIAEADIPATLQASLLARLDRLGSEVKKIAQIGAVIGRDFRHDLVVRVSGEDAEDVSGMLERLTRSELVHRFGTPPDTTYTFKHALVQDAAYDSLLRSNRQEIHRRIADVLIDRTGDGVEHQAQIIAHHLEAAGDRPNASRYWFEAGNEAYDLYANREALAHYEQAVNLIESLPEAGDYAELHLDCQIALGTVGLLVKGPADPALLEANTKAADLCDIVDDDKRAFKLTWGRWFLQHFGAQDPIEAVTTADRLLDIGQRMNDRGLLLQGHHSAWTTYWTREDLHSALEHAQAGIRLYDAEQHSHQHADFGGHDAGMCANGTCGMVNTLLGNLDQSVAYAKQAVKLSEDINHFYSEVFARGFGTTAFLMRRELEPLFAWVDEFSTKVGDYGDAYGVHIATPNIIKGWALVVEGHDVSGIKLLEDNFDVIKRTGFPKINFHLMLLADAQRTLGNVDSALRMIDEAQENATAVHERIWMAEIARTRGNVLIAMGEAEAAISAFQDALAIAKNQDTRLFQLRAARDVAPVLVEHGRADEAFRQLRSSYDQFTEGFDTPDLIEAKALLDELG